MCIVIVCDASFPVESVYINFTMLNSLYFQAADLMFLLTEIVSIISQLHCNTDKPPNKNYFRSKQYVTDVHLQCVKRLRRIYAVV